jgi:hypothetical protein
MRWSGRQRRRFDLALATVKTGARNLCSRPAQRIVILSEAKDPSKLKRHAGAICVIPTLGEVPRRLRDSG